MAGKKVAVVAGAGISTSAGIPDFRGVVGVFSNAEGRDLFNVQSIRYNRDLRTTRMRAMKKECDEAKTTAFHRMLAKVWERGKLVRLYSQNIDTLEKRTPGLKGEAVVILHDSFARLVCERNDVHVEKADGHEIDNTCPLCVQEIGSRSERTGLSLRQTMEPGKLVPRITLYDGPSYDGELILECMNADGARRLDALIVAGTRQRSVLGLFGFRVYPCKTPTLRNKNVIF